MPFDYKKEYKEFYMPPKKPAIVTVPPMNFIAVHGEGDPLIAANKEKAGEMLHSLGLQSPQENTFISFDNSITHTTEDVKYPVELFPACAGVILYSESVNFLNIFPGNLRIKMLKL